MSWFRCERCGRRVGENMRGDGWGPWGVCVECWSEDSPWWLASGRTAAVRRAQAIARLLAIPPATVRAARHRGSRDVRRVRLAL